MKNEVVPIARSYLAQQDNLRISPYGMHLGNRLPAHATSTGKVLLAALTHDEQKVWLDRHGLKTFNALYHSGRGRFLSSPSTGCPARFCLSQEEHELGIHALAVPIYGAIQSGCCSELLFHPPRKPRMTIYSQKSFRCCKTRHASYECAVGVDKVWIQSALIPSRRHAQHTEKGKGIVIEIQI